MAKQIWKYPLRFQVNQNVTLPYFATILNIQIQNNIACMWVLVDDAEEKHDKIIYMFGTGTNDVEYYCSMHDLVYISTTQIAGLVFHWFTER
jgi:hypothetical protein